MATPDEHAQQPKPEPETGVGGDANHASMVAVHGQPAVDGENAPVPNGDATDDQHPSGDGETVLGSEHTGLNGIERNGAGSHGVGSSDGKPQDDGAVPRSAVKIKGRPGGVSIEIGDGEWETLLRLLEDRLVAAEGFFRGGRVLLEVGPRPLGAEPLRQVRRILEAHEMKLGLVRSTAERTLQAAQEIGASTSVDEPEVVREPEVRPPDPVQPRPGHFVHRGNLRSGQVLRKTESVVVIGDVNPGAHVISGGDIMIWGRLRGIAFAGADGNRKAVVTALEFAPTQLRIANLTAVAPEQKKTRGFWPWRKESAHRAEIARIHEGRIVVEPWDDSKAGSPAGARLRPGQRR